MKKSSVSSQQEKLQTGKEKRSRNSDSDSLPELTDREIQSLRRVSKERHSALKEAVANHIGRPKKDPNEKENIVSIRFSKTFLEKLKRKAKEEGFSKWQTYAKHVLEEEVNSR